MAVVTEPLVTGRVPKGLVVQLLEGHLDLLAFGSHQELREGAEEVVFLLEGPLLGLLGGHLGRQKEQSLLNH